MNLSGLNFTAMINAGAGLRTLDVFEQSFDLGKLILLLGLYAIKNRNAVLMFGFVFEGLDVGKCISLDIF
jgi:hypothetical protein